MSITSTFSPDRDGWYFENWGENNHFIDSPDFSWELFRRTYLGVNPTHDCVEAPLDCGFYEIFKGCAGLGNCGGMSLLALALFKFGGYFGFCAPACFYSGVGWPDREDLHRAINVFQARQFSATGIENFLDTVNNGDLDNANAAYNKIKSHLGSGDYAVLSIANDLLGDAAHTVIPYAVDEYPPGEAPGTKYIYVYDPNYSYDDHSDYYKTRSNRVVIRSAYDWEYNQGFYDGVSHGGNPTHYTGGWCFAVPMSAVLRKARHPLAVDMVLDALTTLLVSGTGAAAIQIEDETGKRFYKTGLGVPTKRSEIEPDPAKRLPFAGRWPWFGPGGANQTPGELYFLRRRRKNSALKITVTGTNYKVMLIEGQNIVTIEAKGREHTSDTIHFGGMTSNQQVTMVKNNGRTLKLYDIHHQRLSVGEGNWRSLHLQNVGIQGDGLQLRSIGALDDFEISGMKNKFNFNVLLRQYRAKKLQEQVIGRQSISAGRTARYALKNWDDLSNTRVDKNFYTTPRLSSS